jgi:SAM-dependent methyltransferase
MTKTDDWDSVGVSTEKHNIARYYDYLLGGYHNFEVDRKVGDLVIKACPDIRLGALANRAFLRRAVKFLCQQGVDQFLDLGSGIPTSGNVHEVAQKINPAAHVFYVDNDPVAVIHSQAMLKDNPNATVLQEDIIHIGKILEHPSFTALIDLHRPLGVLMLSVLHFINDEGHLQKILQVLKDRLAPGSYLVISHFSVEGAPIETIAQLNRLAAGGSSNSVSRTLAETSRLFDGFDLVEPGVVRIPSWRPESPEDLLVEEPERALAFAGMGRKL